MTHISLKKKKIIKKKKKSLVKCCNKKFVSKIMIVSNHLEVNYNFHINFRINLYLVYSI